MKTEPARGMLSGKARRAAKSGVAAGQDELGSGREETEMEQGQAGAEPGGTGGS